MIHTYGNEIVQVKTSKNTSSRKKGGGRNLRAKKTDTYPWIATQSIPNVFFFGRWGPTGDWRQLHQYEAWGSSQTILERSLRRRRTNAVSCFVTFSTFYSCIVHHPCNVCNSMYFFFFSSQRSVVFTSFHFLLFSFNIFLSNCIRSIWSSCFPFGYTTPSVSLQFYTYFHTFQHIAKHIQVNVSCLLCANQCTNDSESIAQNAWHIKHTVRNIRSNILFSKNWFCRNDPDILFHKIRSTHTIPFLHTEFSNKLCRIIKLFKASSKLIVNPAQMPNV